MTKYAKFKIYKILQIFHGHIPKLNFKSPISFEIKNKILSLKVDMHFYQTCLEDRKMDRNSKVSIQSDLNTGRRNEGTDMK